MRYMKKVIFAILIIIYYLSLSGCQSRPMQEDNSKYTLATSSNGGMQRTKYVPAALPGQMMSPKNSKTKKLVGEKATDEANEKSIKKATSGEYINSIMVFDYIEGALYQIYTAPLSVTDIQFQENEHIIAVGAGDTTRWKVTKTHSGLGVNRKEHLLVKPIEDGLTNGVVVTTDQRTYHLILNSTPKTYMASVAWRYPDDDGLIAISEDDEYDADPMVGIDINNMNFNYEIKLLKGRVPNWYPSMVFHDGRKTYIKFPNHAQDAPSLFIVEENMPRIINYRVKGNYYIIDKVIFQAQLRSGLIDNKQTVVRILMKK